MLLFGILGVLLTHLLVSENPVIAKHLHLTPGSTKPPEKYISLPLQSTSPESTQELKEKLKEFVPRTDGPAPRIKANGFLAPYFDLEERVLPRLTRAALNAWAAHAEQWTNVSEEVLLQHARAAATTATTAGDANHDDAEDAHFFDLLAFLHPPAQQQGHFRAAMNNILGFGTRVGGTMREPLLHHLLHEGLGRGYYDANEHRYHDAAVHLSQTGKTLLERAAALWPSSPEVAVRAATDDADRLSGWRWSLLWDNFTTAIPTSVRPEPPSPSPSSVSLQNLVFQFPGGSQFRRKRAALAQPHDIFVGHRPNRLYNRTHLRENLFADEYHPLDATGDVYTQEAFIGPGRPSPKFFHTPYLMRGVPGTTAEIGTPGQRVPLKPTLSTPVSEPVSRQPVQHAVYAAHWDSMMRSDMRFLGACDSAMPMVFLLRKIKNIAVLTDVAEALTESYKAERIGTAGVVPAGAIVPGLTTTFRKSTTEAEVRARLAQLLSPAHHALLYGYFFAQPYSVGGDGDGSSPPSNQPPGSRNYASGVVVDVRMWLDWVQHLPAISVILFDAEEAFEKWAGTDHTYGSRHLARRWRNVATAAQTRYSGGPQSLFDTVDLFSLYDLMGPAGTTFYNIYPTQSGIYYAALAQKEEEKRKQALYYTTTITSELLWRVLGTSEDVKKKTVLTNATTVRSESAADPYVRQLGSSVDVAIAAVDQRHVTRVLANPASRPSQDALPRPWLLYGAPHEMLTLHRISLPEFSAINNGLGALAEARQYDAARPGLTKHHGFNIEHYIIMLNTNIFFSPARTSSLRRSGIGSHLQDDQLHWLDTQRVLHLISYPFPKSWHEESDDGRDIHDGTSVDLANVLWSTTLELGHYWTGEGDGA